MSQERLAGPEYHDSFDPKRFIEQLQQEAEKKAENKAAGDDNGDADQ